MLIQRMTRQTVLPNSLTLWSLGQMGFAIQAPQGVIFIDPYLSDSVRQKAGEDFVRAFPPPVLPQDMTNASAFLITHEHLDHLDPLTVPLMAQASPSAPIITSGWCVQPLLELGVTAERIHAPQALQPHHWAEWGVTITAVPSAHPTLEHDAQKGHRWLGFLLEWNGVTLYHAGDTVIYPDYVDILRALPKADVAILPINGRDWEREQRGLIGNLLPREAAYLAKTVGWDMVIIGHNDLFPINTLPMGEIFQAFATHTPRQSVHYMQPSERYTYQKD